MRTRTSAIVALVCIALLSVAAPAHAHDELVSSTPEQGQQLNAAPTTVSVTFAEQLLDVGNAIEVLDANGSMWTDGTVTVDGATVTASVTPNMPDGVYTMNWRVVSADGHPVGSTIVFGVGASETVTEDLALAMAAHGQPGNEAPTVEAQETAGQATASSADSGNQALVFTAIGVLAAGLLLVGVVLVRRSRAKAE